MNPRCFPTDQFVPYFTTAILQAVKKIAIVVDLEFRVASQYEPPLLGPHSHARLTSLPMYM
jgi:hypothetical protein